MNEQKDLALISADELNLADASVLNEFQLQQLLKRTPKNYIHERPAKGGGKWKYVTGGYMKKVLNLMFGFEWDFEILSEQVIFDEVVVKGKLTCRSNGKSIIKTQYGNKDIIYRKQIDVNAPKVPLSIGNDMKAAATDCLKKCAAEIGIAADIYNEMDFKEVFVDTSENVELDELVELFMEVEHKLSNEDCEAANRIIHDKESKSYNKLYKQLKKIK